MELDKSLEVSTRLRSNTGLYAKRTWKGFSLSTSCSAVRAHGPSTQQVGMGEVCRVSQEMRGREECSPLHGAVTRINLLVDLFWLDIHFEPDMARVMNCGSLECVWLTR